MIEDGIVLKGTQIVVPTKKHEAVLKLIHEGYLGLMLYKVSFGILEYWVISNSTKIMTPRIPHVIVKELCNILDISNFS